VDWLNSFIITILCVVLLTALCNALMPEGNLSKFANMVLGLVVVITILGSVIGLRNIDFNTFFAMELTTEDSQSGAALYAENIANTFCINLAENIETRVLQNFGCDIDAQVSVTIDEQGSISGIDKISLYIPPQEDVDAVVGFVAETYGASNVVAE